MWHLKGRERLDNWQEIDKIDPNDGSEHPIEERKDYMLKEYKETFGRSWHFVWEWRE